MQHILNDSPDKKVPPFWSVRSFLQILGKTEMKLASSDTAEGDTLRQSQTSDAT